jgi:hypothetical protein
MAKWINEGINTKKMKCLKILELFEISLPIRRQLHRALTYVYFVENQPSDRCAKCF